MGRETDNFRLLLVLSIATWLFAMYMSFRATPPPAEITSLYEWRGFGEVVPGFVDARLFWVQELLRFGGLIGMCFFSRIARGAVLAAMILNPLRTALGGIWVSAPLEDSFWALHWLFFTFAVGMAFFSDPVRTAFRCARHARAKSS
jgi:hypothetical protein